jgi:hypothetical protein
MWHRLVSLGLFASVGVGAALAASFAVGAAPKGDAKVVASRIIKYNFPSCKRVAGAVRQADGSIRAACDGTEYLVFTVFKAQEGKLVEVALNCSFARQMGVNC